MHRQAPLRQAKCSASSSPRAALCSSAFQAPQPTWPRVACAAASTCVAWIRHAAAARPLLPAPAATPTPGPAPERAACLTQLHCHVHTQLHCHVHTQLGCHVHAQLHCHVHTQLGCLLLVRTATRRGPCHSPRASFCSCWTVVAMASHRIRLQQVLWQHDSMHAAHMCSRYKLAW